MDDYYLRDPSVDPDDIFRSPTEYCKSCPTNATCPDNTTLETLGIKRGFWRASPSSAVLTECRLFGGDSEAGKKRCAGSEPGEASRRRRMVEAGSEYCAPGFAGPECQLCVAENHYLDDGEKCKECTPRGAAAGRIVGLVLGLCVACGLAAWAYNMPKWREKPYIGRLLRLADRAVYWYVAIGLTAKTKILFGFYQIVTVLSTTYSTRLPPEYTSWTDAVADAVSIDWSGFFLPQQCLGYGLRLHRPLARRPHSAANDRGSKSAASLLAHHPSSAREALDRRGGPRPSRPHAGGPGARLLLRALHQRLHLPRVELPGASS